MGRQKKTYIANTVEAAFALARKELGGDALLVDVGPAAAPEDGAGAYRVAFEYEAPAAREASSPASGSTAGGSGAQELVPEALGAELARLSSLVEQMAAMVAQYNSVPELAGLAARMASHDLPPELAQRCLGCVERRLGLKARHAPVTGHEARLALREELRSLFEVAPALGGLATPPAIAALVGPPGSGKTATTVKLAMREGIAARRPTLIVSTDTHRVAAAEQLRIYAAILGAPFQVADSPAALRQILAENGNKALILIDTPGFGPKDRDWAEEWAAMFAGTPAAEVHLVLPATTRAADMVAAARWWEFFRPAKLIFTRMDETTRTGACIAAAAALRKPVSFLGTGQRIPEDLEEATEAKLLGWLEATHCAAGAAAA